MKLKILSLSQLVAETSKGPADVLPVFEQGSKYGRAYCKNTVWTGPAGWEICSFFVDQGEEFVVLVQNGA